MKDKLLNELSDMPKLYYDMKDKDKERLNKAIQEIRDRSLIDKPEINKLKKNITITQDQYNKLSLLMKKLKGIRQKNHPNLMRFCKETGLNRSFILQIENFKRLNFTIDTLFRYALAVGVDLNFIVKQK